MKNAIYIITLFAYFCAGRLSAQTDTNNSFTEFMVPEMRILQDKNNQNTEYGFKYPGNYVIILNDSMKVDPDKYKYTVSLNDIRQITIKGGSSFWQGAIGGAVTGFVSGFFAGLSFSSRADVLGGIAGGLMMTLPVAAIFGSICMGMTHDIEYDLGGYPLLQKKALLIKILRDNRLKK